MHCEGVLSVCRKENGGLAEEAGSVIDAERSPFCRWIVRFPFILFSLDESPSLSKGSVGLLRIMVKGIGVS